MKIVIAGGTGFLGNPLAWAWAEESHDVRVLTRSLPAGQAQHESGTGKPGITRIGWSPDGHAGELARALHGWPVIPPESRRLPTAIPNEVETDVAAWPVVKGSWMLSSLLEKPLKPPS